MVAMVLATTLSKVLCLADAKAATVEAEVAAVTVGLRRGGVRIKIVMVVVVRTIRAAITFTTTTSQLQVSMGFGSLRAL